MLATAQGPDGGILEGGRRLCWPYCKGAPMTGYRFQPLQDLPRLGPAPLPARDPRFAPAPAELCQLAGTWDGQALGPDWICEPKHDGIRLLWIGGQMVTRTGEPFHAAEHLRPEFERLERRC